MKKKQRYFALLALLLSCSLLPACGPDAITVVDRNGNSIEVSTVEKDTYTFQLPGSQTATKEPSAASWANPFIDISEGTWYYDAVRYCYENGLMRGTGKNTFQPDLPTNRAMIAATIWRLENTPSADAAPFLDIPTDRYYTQAVAWASEHDIIAGYDRGHFGPENNITREQLAAILYRYADYKGYAVSQQTSLEGFLDGSEASGYAKNALSWALEKGILHGMEGQTLLPRSDATRAQVAAILMQWCEWAEISGLP